MDVVAPRSRSREPGAPNTSHTTINASYDSLTDVVAPWSRYREPGAPGTSHTAVHALYDFPIDVVVPRSCAHAWHSWNSLLLLAIVRRSLPSRSYHIIVLVLAEGLRLFLRPFLVVS
jgi:hypothetical protein